MPKVMVPDKQPQITEMRMASSLPPSAETGNGFIDGTHAALLRRIGDIREHCDEGSPQVAIVPAFNAFVGAVTAHFGQEELILRASGFSAWEEHADEHRALGQQVGRLVDYVRGCEVSGEFLRTVAGTLDTMLSQHEIRHDGAYTGLLRAAAVPPPDADLIAWSAGFDTGLEPIDAQHRELAAFINELHRMACGVHAQADAMDLLDRVAEHLRRHFETEERVMRRVAPSRFLSHAASHADMAEQFQTMREEVASGVIGLDVAVRDFLRFWLMDHIVVCDRPHLRADLI